ncbi:hypothetical protein JRQ81_005040 [Phrynocephalus forsythii]|uniref:HTH CENPB-type domain-containing protein n=1 Tax=Phrynocephalus forsythii TaxID=171643 RepID=A0A9Q0XJ76_9SAUR|nr:hypothetical protein JRQ81_005040 [Phrynocephalus forsythii]
MAPKKAAEAGKRKRKLILLEDKREIICKHDAGVRLVDLAREYARNTSTIATILEDKERIMGRDTAKGVTNIIKNWLAVMDQVENLLLLWIREKVRAGDTVTQAVICAKARALHADLTSQQPAASQEEFKASHGWFNRFRQRCCIHSVLRQGKAASSDLQAAENFAPEFLEIVISEGYLPEQVFNCDAHPPGLEDDLLEEFQFIRKDLPSTQHHTTHPAHGPAADFEFQEALHEGDVPEMPGHDRWFWHHPG